MKFTWIQFGKMIRNLLGYSIGNFVFFYYDTVREISYYFYLETVREMRTIFYSDTVIVREKTRKLLGGSKS